MSARLTFCLAFGVVVLVGPVRKSHAQDKGESTLYTVQAGDTCVGIATRFYGDKRLVDVIHSANPTMGPSPHNLKAGTQLVLPPKPIDPEAGKPDATVTRVRNQVEVTTTAPKPAKENDPLFRGNRVGTKAASAADVTFRDETQVKLGEDTLVVILGDTDARASRIAGTDMTLVTGELRARLSELAGKRPTAPRVTTSAGVVAMKDGEAKVTSDESKTTRVAVYRGGSTLTAQTKTVTVNDGFGSKALRDSAPTPPQPLPPAPEWASPPPPVLIALEPVDVTFSFAPSAAPGPAAAGWHVQMARDSEFDDIVVDQKTPLAIRRIEAKNVAGGTYFARVSAIDADRFEGKWGPVARTTVGRLGMTALPARRGQLTIEGDGLSCHIAGTPSVLPFEVDRDRQHTVACAAGGSPVGSVEVPRMPIGRARAHADFTALRDRAGTLRVTIVDELGYGIGNTHPAIVPVRDLRIEGLRESATKGVYVATYTWSSRPRPTTLQIRMLDQAVVETDHIPFDRDTTPPPRAELGAGALLSSGLGGRPPLGVGFDVEGRVAVATRTGAVLVGASAGWAALFDAAHGGSSADGSAIAARGFVGYRFGHRSVGPYLTLGPTVIRQRVDVEAVEGREWLVGGVGAAGLDLEVGPGALFLEARARIVAPVAKEQPSLPGSAGLFLAGYRFHLPGRR